MYPTGTFVPFGSSQPELMCGRVGLSHFPRIFNLKTQVMVGQSRKAYFAKLQCENTEDMDWNANVNFSSLFCRNSC